VTKCPRIFLERLTKIMKSLWVNVFWAVIWIQYVPNSKQGYYILDRHLRSKIIIFQLKICFLVLLSRAIKNKFLYMFYKAVKFIYFAEWGQRSVWTWSCQENTLVCESRVALRNALLRAIRYHFHSGRLWRHVTRMEKTNLLRKLTFGSQRSDVYVSTGSERLSGATQGLFKRGLYLQVRSICLILPLVAEILLFRIELCF